MSRRKIRTVPGGAIGYRPTKGQDGAPLYSASALSFRASDRRHWRGNPSLQCGGTHGSRPTECGAERAGRVVRPYTVCHCEPVLTLARQFVPPMRRDTWVPLYRVRRRAGGQSRPPLHALSLRASAHTGAAIRSSNAAGHMGPALQSAARSGRTESSAPTHGYRGRFMRDVEDAVPYGTVIRAFRVGRRGRCPLRNLPQNVQRIV